MNNRTFDRPFLPERRWWLQNRALTAALAGSLALAGFGVLEKHDTDPCRAHVQLKHDEAGVQTLHPSKDTDVQLFVGAVQADDTVGIDYLAYSTDRQPGMFGIFTSEKTTSTTVDLNQLDTHGPEVTYRVDPTTELRVDISVDHVLTTSCQQLPPVNAEH